MKILFAWVAAFSADLAQAQQNVGIGTTNPNASAVLEVRSTNKGILIPRVHLSSETDVTTISNPSSSLLVYNINGTLPDGDGFYFWNGTKWIKLATRSNLTNLAWGIAGNAGTNANTDFIGTTDNKALVFKTNNVLSGKIAPATNTVFLGYSAGSSITSGSNNTFLGDRAGENDTSGSANLFAGHLAGSLNLSGSENVFLGQEAGKSNTTGSKNTFIGEDAGISNTSGNDNLFIGNQAGRENTTASGNVAVGKDVFLSNTTGANNTAIGTRALRNNMDHFNNTAVGFEALYSNGMSGGSLNNTAVGYLALRANTGSRNTAVGSGAMQSTTSSLHNTGIGAGALGGNTTGDDNVAVGLDALIANSIGNKNTAIGAYANVSIQNLFNATVVGANATVSSSNTMTFGDDNVDRWAFGLSTTTGTLALEVGSNSTNGNGAYLTQGGTWTNTCDFYKKEDFSSVNESDLLHKISQLNIQRWKYKGSNEYHIGPTAQEFHKLFNVGVDDKGISTVDPSGIALAAIQVLIKENESLKKELQEIRQLIEPIKQSK